MARARHFVFEWRDGHAFELLVDSGDYFPRMLQAIDRATRFIALEMYLIESGQVTTRFIDALVYAAQRGVAVYALFDHFGSLGLNDADRARLLAGGIRVGYYNPLRLARFRRSFYRDHRKLLLVDSEVVFTGGTGMTDEYDPAVTARVWRDTMIEIRGPAVRDWCLLFGQAWESGTGTVLSRTDGGEPGVGTQRGRVVANYARGKRQIMRSLLNRTRAARHTLWLATAYFVPPWKLRRALRAAARRGVDVRLLLPGPRSDHPGVRRAGHRHFAGLLRNGVRIFEYQPRFMHQKVILSDDWVSIGSSNVDRWGQRWNLEANQEVDDAAFAASVAQMLSVDFTESIEVTYAQWRNRWFGRRVLEWFWGKIDGLVERFER